MNRIKLEWRLRLKTSEYRRHLDHAKQTIHTAQNKGKSAISWSAGKDSTAMAHLIKSLYPETPIIIQFDDCDWPEKRPYAERVAKSHGWNFHAVQPDFSVWEKSLQYQIGNEDICSQSHELTRDSFLSPIKAKQWELGCQVIFIGLRSQESRSRYFNWVTRGELYQLKNDEWHCCPLGRWTAEDVFSYMVDHEIEINPCYFRNRFKQPEQIRLSWALPTPTGICYGDLEHIRFYYPQQFQRLRDRGVQV